MRTSLALSLVMHGLLLTLALAGFGASHITVNERPVSVDVVTPGAISALKAGRPDEIAELAKPTAPPKSDQPATPPAASEARPAERASEKQAALPPPKPKTPAGDDKPPQAKPESRREPKAPAEETKTEVLPAPPKKPEAPKPRPEPARREERPARAAPERERREAETRQDRGGDRIADLIGGKRLPAQSDGNGKFDPQRIAALLNRDPTAGERPQTDGPREPWRKPRSLEEQAAGFSASAPAAQGRGDPAGRDSRITANEIDAFRAQVSRCWTPPVGGLGGDAIIVKLRIALNEDGTLGSPPSLANDFPSPFFRPAADSAVRAIMQCQPYRMLPPEKYSQWRDMLLTFDPRRMYGG